MNRKLILVAVATVALMTSSTQAEIIVQYTSISSLTDPLITAGTINVNVTADPLSAGPGLIANSGSTWNWRDWDVASASFADAVAAGDFWTWGFDVATAATVMPTTLDIRLDRSGTGPDDIEIQASVNGGLALSLLTHDYVDDANAVNFVGVDLSALGPLVQGDSVVFTFAGFNSESAAGTFDLETITFPGGTDSLTINGNISTVPEPSSLLALAAIGVARAVRRRRIN